MPTKFQLCASLLRNVVMELVAKFCHDELEAYGNCVQENPLIWHTKCAELKKTVSNCSSSHPSIQRIKRDCHKQFQVYDYCLRNNPSQVHVCLPALQEFFTCGNNIASEQQLKADMPTPEKAPA